jgi:hypothetical protein
MADHWPVFVEFVAAERAAGGPDAQLALLAELARMHECDQTEKVWMAGCYGAVHCVPTAFVTWQEFRPQEVVADNKRLSQWLLDNWDALPMRVEMRSARMLEKRLDCLTDFARYALDYKPGLTYNQRWHHSQVAVKYYGRYMAIKFLELLRQMLEPELIAPDIRSKDGWSPRRSLALLHPEVPILAEATNKSVEAVKAMEDTAIDIQAKLNEAGIPISFFQLQVLLCNYREALNGGFYPGGGHDEEMDFMEIVSKKFSTTLVYVARRNIFDQRYLGELNDWFGLRRAKFLEWKQKGEDHFGPQRY